MSTTKVTTKQQHWLDHFQAAEASSLSLTAYARQHELDPKRFHHWVYQLRRRGLIPASEAQRSTGSFVRVGPVDRAASAPPADIVLPNGVRLRVPTLSKALLSDLLALQVAP